MKKVLLFFLLIIIIIPKNTNAQDEKDNFGIKFSGFVSSEFFYDTRQMVTAREGDVMLFPSNELLGTNGKDINAVTNFNMLAIHSRLRAKISAPSVMGAKLSGLVEFDFAGNKNATINHIRMRHVIVKLQWKKTGVLFGQYWHPMFVTQSYPKVPSWGAAVPVGILTRAPQLRVTHNFNKEISLMFAAVSQRDFATTGPNGASSEYLRNSGIPEMHTQFVFKNKTVTAGFTAGYKIIKPRTTDILGNKSDETIGGFNSNVFLGYNFGPVTVNVHAIYGENLYNLLMLGGYAESLVDSVNGKYEYTNYKTGSVWTEIMTNGKSIRGAIFAGYTKNMGTNDPIDPNGAVYARGSTVENVLRIAPRIEFLFNQLKIYGEVTYTTAAYGTLQRTDGKVIDANSISGSRLLMGAMFSF